MSRASRAPANRSVLERAGIDVNPASDIVSVEGLELHLSTGFWRSDDGKRGYNVRSFIAEFGRRQGLPPKLLLP